MSESMDIDDLEEIEVKVILFGDQRVGKTNLIRLATKQEFNPQEESTLSPSNFTLNMEIDGIKFKINLWDIAG